jgi:hypothetical protein
MIKHIYKYAVCLLILGLIFSCDEDDADGHSTKMATSPSLLVTLDFNNTETLIEDEVNYTYTISLSEKQNVDVRASITQTGGDATEGEDFTFDHHVTISAGSLSALGTISILSDDIIEETETVQLSITTGAEANVSSINGEVVEFSIENLTSGDLLMNMSWAPANELFDTSGTSYDAVDLADLILTLKDDGGNVMDSSDGSGFESLTIAESDADGDYFIEASFFSVTDLGDSGYFDLNLNLMFDQVGTINGQTHEFASALNSEYACDAVYYRLAKVTKTGGSYSFEELSEKVSPTLPVGTYDVISSGESTDPGPPDNPFVDFVSTVSISANDDGTYTISDGWAGVYVYWYSVYGISDDEPVTLTYNACNGEISAAWTGPFGGSQTYEGQDNGDGTLTVKVSNSWGDEANFVYTLQP